VQDTFWRRIMGMYPKTNELRGRKEERKKEKRKTERKIKERKRK
jgi:hypothetical protein